MAEFFGFKFERVKNTGSTEQFTEPSSDDGAIETAGGGFYGQLLDTDGRERNEQDLIRRYRDIAQQPECDSAIEDIINEGIVANEKDQAVAIELDNLQYTKKIKDRIREEFDSVLELLDFDTKGHDIFRRWYVDGRLYYHKVITYVPSGLMDQNKGHVLSYLHKAIKPVNQLRMIEDALVIYRISRAPERRIFYIDVGNLPKIKAEQYLKDVMNRYRNKLVYDASTGEIRDDRRFLVTKKRRW